MGDFVAFDVRRDESDFHNPYTCGQSQWTETRVTISNQTPVNLCSQTTSCFQPLFAVLACRVFPPVYAQGGRELGGTEINRVRLVSSFVNSNKVGPVVMVYRFRSMGLLLFAVTVCPVFSGPSQPRSPEGESDLVSWLVF